MCKPLVYSERDAVQTLKVTGNGAGWGDAVAIQSQIAAQNRILTCEICVFVLLSILCIVFVL